MLFLKVKEVKNYIQRFRILYKPSKFTNKIKSLHIIKNSQIIN